MEDGQEAVTRHVVGGVDTHKDLHVAAVVDEHDRVHRAVSLTIGICPVVLTELLGNVCGDGIDDGTDAGLVEPVAICPLCHRMRIEQAIASNLRLVAFDIGLHLVRVCRHSSSQRNVV
jgi:hypothetical protein